MQNNQENKLILLKDLGYKFPKETSKRKAKYSIYKCFCGKEFETQDGNIKNGNTKSCGCLKGNRSHGLTNHRLFRTWKGMIGRCNNPSHKFYKNYGLRGISVCSEWLDINNFINDMYPSFVEGLTLDRIDNNKGYNKENCRWTSREIQNRNTRVLYNHNTSGYRGSHFNKQNNKWISQIKVNSKQIHLGCFNTAIEAAKAYDNYVICNNLEHTKNF